MQQHDVSILILDNQRPQVGGIRLEQADIIMTQPGMELKRFHNTSLLVEGDLFEDLLYQPVIQSFVLDSIARLSGP